MRIGLISDSHHKVDVAKSAINFLKKKDVDLLVHSGDIVEFETLRDLKKSQIPYVAVLGNNDSNLKSFMKNFKLFNEPKDFIFKDLKIRVMHYPIYISNDFDINIYGHTHYFVAVVDGKNLVINPGEICGRKKPLYEFAYVDVFDDRYEIYKISSQIEKIDWKISKIDLFKEF